MVMRLAGIGLALSLVLGGCAGSTEERLKAQAEAACPKTAVVSVVENRAFLESLMPGETLVKALRRGPTPVKMMALTNPHEKPLAVYFYRTATSGCSWLVDTSNHTPVIAETSRKGKILGVGRETLQTLQAQGWQLSYREGWAQARYTAPPWPWQGWDYTYLPYK